MERQRSYLATPYLAMLGLVLSVFLLATESEMAPLATLVFCCGVLLASVWLKTPGAVLALALGLLGDFFFRFWGFSLDVVCRTTQCCN